MAGSVTDILSLIREECNFPLRYPPVPELSADTLLDQRWFGPVDRVCVQMKLEDELGFEIASDDAEAWASVGDIIQFVERARIAA